MEREKDMSTVGQAFIRFRPKPKKDSIIEVGMAIKHPQHTGLKKDIKTGKVVPAFYITNVDVFYGDELVTSMETYPSVSENPYLAVHLKTTRSGPLRIVWKDSGGNVYTKTAKIKV